MTTTVRNASTGRIVPSWHAALLVVEGFWTWYKRNWRASLLFQILQPLLILVAFGLAFGTLVRPGAVTGGVPYLDYLAPALLAMATLQTGAVEASWPIVARFKWQRTYLAIIATPVTPGQVLGGQLLWIALRVGQSGLVFLLVAMLFGGIGGWGSVAALLFAVLCGVAFAAPLVAFSATVEREAHKLNAVFRFVVLPMTLFSGTYFPISQLPVWGQVLAWISPLWHGTELARGAALGTLEPLPALGHTAYLAALVAVGAELARRRYVKRLGV